MHTHMTHYLITNEPQIYSGREWHWETQTATATCKGIKLDHSTPYLNINSRWIKDLRAKHETFKFLKGKGSSKLLDVGFDI